MSHFVSRELHIALSALVCLCNIVAIILSSVPMSRGGKILIEQHKNFDTLRIYLIVQLVSLLILNLALISEYRNDVVKFISFLSNLVALLISVFIIGTASYTHDNKLLDKDIRNNDQYKATLGFILISGSVSTILTSLRCY